ncbi:winged helix-turn-helix domain-containing protein [Halopiger xanaduensis]|uniref:DUF7845 domain-containing protein n=1 Tax=Halopiger xanaduensis (strain DSM 18323 / JCM 14033 / SH-6) TaxID=797210 RepID=F8D4R6_HALXS|nr:winged helix-turn-helix domain-containing protein [Halopiger xanaduensis]AEH37535.1 hypothetical protein Halxa_2919 [Halopiger xanaduensis SH-6]
MSLTNSASIPTGKQKTTLELVEDTFESQPIVHKGVWKYQLNDDNELYLKLWKLVQSLHNSDEENREPFLAGPINPPHTAGDAEYYVGIKSWQGDHYYDGSNLYEYSIGLYESDETKPGTPAKASMTIRRRSHGMETSSGDAVTWPKADDGDRKEGSYIEVQGSYLQNFEDAHAVARIYLRALVKEFTDLDDLAAQSLVHDLYEPYPATEHVGQLEAHYRYSKEYERGVVHAIGNSFALMEIQGASLESRAKAKRGRYGIKRVDAAAGAFDTIGFETPESLCDDSVPDTGIMLKTYNDKNVHLRADDDPLNHPKIEAAAKGTVHRRYLDEVRHHLARICIGHLRFAGLDANALVSDLHFTAQTGRISVETPTLSARSQQLESYRNDPDLRHAVEDYLRRRQTNSFRDILLVLYERGDQGATYQEIMDKTGLAYDTVRNYIRRFNEAGIIRKTPGTPLVITWKTPEAKGTVEDTINDEGKTPGEAREERRERKKERETDSAWERLKGWFSGQFRGVEKDTSKESPEADRDDENTPDTATGEYTPLPNHSRLDCWEMLKVAREHGDITDTDIALR